MPADEGGGTEKEGHGENRSKQRELMARRDQLYMLHTLHVLKETETQLTTGSDGSQVRSHMTIVDRGHQRLMHPSTNTSPHR